MSTHRTNPKAGWVELSKLPKGPNGRPLCRRCDQEVPSGRRSFCCAPCIHEWKIRTNPGYVREQVERRDQGVCAACDLDTKTLKGQDPDAIKAMGFTRYGHRWEADHILPVIEGGGECGLDNYRTLCIPCHKKATNELRRRRALNRAHAHNQGVLTMKPETIEAPGIQEIQDSTISDTNPPIDETIAPADGTIPSADETQAPIQDGDLAEVAPAPEDPAPADAPPAQDPGPTAALDPEDDDMVERTWGKRYLERALTDEERLNIGMEMATALETAEELEVQKKNYDDRQKALITTAYETATTLGASLRAGKREGDVNVQIVKNWRDGSYRVTRTDTQEVLENRPMTYHERQQVLPIEVDAAPASTGPMDLSSLAQDDERGTVDQAGTFGFPAAGESAHDHPDTVQVVTPEEQATPSAATSEQAEPISPVDAMAMTAAGKVGHA